MTNEQIKNEIENGKSVLGIEFGSTRIKAILINSQNEVVAQGAHDWENSLVNGIWTYSMEEVMSGLKKCYASLKQNVLNEYSIKLATFASMGFSAMMHGYLAFDKNDNLLVPFRTWRNTISGEASEKLSKLFDYPIPERWSISHLYQAILNNEPHVKDIAYMTTLSGFIHWKLTGQKVLGIGDASGMFPIDINTSDFNQKFISQFDTLVADKKFSWKLGDILPKVLVAGKNAGTLTAEGAKLIDEEGDLKPGIILAPPEGDAGTGMVATNSVAKRTGNVSAGTSVFAMVVLEKELSKSYSGKIDLVTTPDGALVAMSHANNCTGDYDAWISLFGEAIAATGGSVKKGQLYDALLAEALNGEKDCGGLLPFNYISGETMTGFTEGRPLFARMQNSHFNLANFMRAQLFSALANLRVGMDILFDDEKVKIDSLLGHGGFFKTANVGLSIMAAAMHTPVSALETAGEGGPWGMAILANYLVNGKGVPLGEWLNKEVFASAKRTTATPTKEDIDGFNNFFSNYKKGLAMEKAAVENI